MTIVKKGILPKGFKAKAERVSLEKRAVLGVPNYSPLSAFDLAASMGIKIYTPDDFALTSKQIQNIVGTDVRDSGWSALTMTTQGGNRIIIHNNHHSPARQQSDLMHELAHVLCEHTQESNHSDVSLPFSMRDYDPVQEEEANILGATLILPREALIWALKGNMSLQAIEQYYIASPEMVRYRVNTTAVMRQLQYSKSR